MSIRAQSLVIALLVTAVFVPPAAAQDESGLIVFESNRAGPLTEIYTMRPDGSAAKRLTRNRVRDISAAWSADGRQIAFSRGLDNWELFRMSADGSAQERLTSTPGDEINAAWAPDGRQIAFERQSGRGLRSDLFVLDADSRVERPITGGPQFAGRPKLTPDWSPDGDRLVYAVDTGSDFDIAVTELSTGATRLLTDNAVDDLRPRFSPDGSRLVFSRTTGTGSQLVVADAGGGSEQTLRTSRRDSFAASWSPVGTSIAFSAPNRRDRDAQGEYEILRIDLGTSAVRQLTTSHPGRSVAPDWGSAAASPLARLSAVIPPNPPPTLCDWTGNNFANLKHGSLFAADVLCGKGGNDRLYGHGGNDTLKAGWDDDRVYGGDGSDDLITRGDHEPGDAPVDRADGGAGADEAWVDCYFDGTRLDRTVRTAWRCG